MGFTDLKHFKLFRLNVKEECQLSIRPLLFIVFFLDRNVEVV